MSLIVAGRMETQPRAQDAISELQRAGFPPDKIASFYVNPPGMHATYPVGGDVAISRGAEDTTKGAAAGAATGAAAGLATTPVLGPVGPLLGAYIGSLIGGLAETKERDQTEAVDRPHEHVAGQYVAVVADTDEQQRLAVEAFEKASAFDIEVARGTIENGDWIDFNPVAPPLLIKSSAAFRP